MPGLVKIKLRGSGLIIEVLPMVAAARVAGGTAEYVPPLAETMVMQGGAERAVSPQQNPAKRKK